MPDIRPQFSCSKGFTLIEVSVTVAIFAILTAIGMASYLSWKPGYVFRDAVSEVRGDLESAKMRAVETRKQCRVTFSTTGYVIEDGNRVMNSNAWGNVDSDGVHTAGTPNRSVTLDDFPQITLADGAGSVITAGSEPEIVFSPRGTAQMDSLTVLHPNMGSATIAVNITGNITITWP